MAGATLLFKLAPFLQLYMRRYLLAHATLARCLLPGATCAAYYGEAEPSGLHEAWECDASDVMALVTLAMHRSSTGQSAALTCRPQATSVQAPCSCSLGASPCFKQQCCSICQILHMLHVVPASSAVKACMADGHDWLHQLRQTSGILRNVTYHPAQTRSGRALIWSRSGVLASTDVDRVSCWVQVKP